MNSEELPICNDCSCDMILFFDNEIFIERIKGKGFWSRWKWCIPAHSARGFTFSRKDAIFSAKAFILDLEYEKLPNT